MAEILIVLGIIGFILLLLAIFVFGAKIYVKKTEVSPDDLPADDDLNPEDNANSIGGFGSVFVGALLILAGVFLILRVEDQSGQNPITVLVAVIAVFGLIALGLRFLLFGALQIVFVNLFRYMPKAGPVIVAGIGLIAWAWTAGDWGTGRGEGASAAANAIRFVWVLPRGFECGTSYKDLVGAGQSSKSAYIHLRNVAARSGVNVVTVKEKSQEQYGIVIRAGGCRVNR